MIPAQGPFPSRGRRGPSRGRASSPGGTPAPPRIFRGPSRGTPPSPRGMPPSPRGRVPYLFPSRWTLGGDPAVPRRDAAFPRGDGAVPLEGARKKVEGPRRPLLRPGGKAGGAPPPLDRPPGEGLRPRRPLDRPRDPLGGARARIFRPRGKLVRPRGPGTVAPTSASSRTAAEPRPGLSRRLIKAPRSRSSSPALPERFQDVFAMVLGQVRNARLQSTHQVLDTVSIWTVTTVTYLDGEMLTFRPPVIAPGHGGEDFEAQGAALA